MADPQRTADKRLRHLLTLDGLPAAILRALIEDAAACHVDEGVSSVAPLQSPGHLPSDGAASSAPADKTLADQTIANKTLADQAPADQASTNQTPTDQTPTDQTPTDQTPANKTPADHTHPGRTVLCVYDGIDASWQRWVDTALACLAHQSGWVVRRPQHALRAADARPATVAGWARPGEIMVLAHPESGAAHAVAAHVAAGVSVVNLLDGMHAAPIAALCDLATLWRRLPDLHTRSVLLRGDLRGDPRLRGLIHALTTLGVPQVRVVHDDVDLDEAGWRLGVQSCRQADLAAAVGSADVLMDYACVAPGESPRFHGLPACETPGRTPAQDAAAMLAAVFGTVRRAP